MGQGKEQEKQPEEQITLDTFDKRSDDLHLHKQTPLQTQQTPQKLPALVPQGADTTDDLGKQLENLLQLFSDQFKTQLADQIQNLDEVETEGTSEDEITPLLTDLMNEIGEPSLPRSIEPPIVAPAVTPERIANGEIRHEIPPAVEGGAAGAGAVDAADVAAAVAPAPVNANPEEEAEENGMFGREMNEEEIEAELERLGQNWWLTLRVLTLIVLIGIQLPRQTMSYWAKAAIILVIVAFIEAIFVNIIRHVVNSVKVFLVMRMPFLENIIGLSPAARAEIRNRRNLILLQQREAQVLQAIQQHVDVIQALAQGHGHGQGLQNQLEGLQAEQLAQQPEQLRGENLRNVQLPGAGAPDVNRFANANVALNQPGHALRPVDGLPRRLGFPAVQPLPPAQEETISNDRNLTFLKQHGIPLPRSENELARLKVADVGNLTLPPKSWFEQAIRVVAGFFASFFCPGWEPPKIVYIQNEHQLREWIDQHEA